MKNKLGHDNKSEIVTIIARLREKRFNVISFCDKTIQFEVVLTHRTTVPVSNIEIERIKYAISRCPKAYHSFDYYIKQLNGIDNRSVPFSDGYIIWSLLEESVVHYT